MRFILVNFILYFVLSIWRMELLAKNSLHYHELLKIMKKHSFILKENKSRIEEAFHLKNSVSSFVENPMLTMGVMNSPLVGFPSIDREGMSGYTIGLSQSFYMPWKKDALEKELQARLALSHEEFHATEQYLAYEVLVRYNRLYFTQQKMKILEEIEKNLEELRKLFSKGITEKLSFNLLQKLLQDLEKQKNEIKQTIWEEANLISELKNFLSVDLEYFLALSDLKEVLLKNPLPEFSLKESPLYQVAEKQEAVAKAALFVAKGQLFGEFRLEGTYLIRRPSLYSHGEDLLTVAIAFPLPITYTFREKEKILASEKSYEQYTWRRKQIVQQVEREVQLLKEREQILQQNLESIQKKILPTLKNFIKSQSGLVLSGKSDFSQVLESFRELQIWQLQEIKLIQEICETRLRIYYLAGKIFSL